MCNDQRHLNFFRITQNQLIKNVGTILRKQLIFSLEFITPITLLSWPKVRVNNISYYTTIARANSNRIQKVIHSHMNIATRKFN
jgi:hypothetical protein